ncbi:MAG: acyclic terpene utilization AtuA family protein [Limnobacter sp.]|uniref:acyclic terpene utilization AtuA family protein n=1 Tax=unclassified Limnobacter TaxID=2630203 RepID=UPI000CF37588|nr:acyclic terpene utilization AtuA family protein [Limnobacter sp. SAORIC-690]PQJ24746.1 terpene utilization protein AtuA [Limnobacter sp. SAORIC-690]
MPIPQSIKIGGACGFWGDSSLGTEQLLKVPGIQYITYDYLAELTLAIMAGMRMKNPEHGYALDFIDLMKRALPAAKSKGIKIIANAGGLNPAGCAAALQQAMTEAGHTIRIGVVSGDDATITLGQLRKDGVELRDQHSGQAAPPFFLTANAYLGAFPIAAALDAGADIVITGRVVDSAMVLGALVHEYRWQTTDLDQLAQGSLAGHIVECGAQATGGLFTDWQRVPDWANIGYPIVEVAADGSFELSKPEGTGGLVNKAVATEQLLYEIHDPANYALPDVVCDFTTVNIEETGPSRVRIDGATGKAPSDQYKVCATYPEGFRCIGMLSIVGFDAQAKARRTGEAILERTRAMFKRQGLADYTRTSIEIIGSETDLGPHAQVQLGHEAMMRIAITHSDKKAAAIFSREIAPAGTSYAPGTSGNFGMGRPNVTPLVKMFSCFVPKHMQTAVVKLGGESIGYQEPEHPKPSADIPHSAEKSLDNISIPGELLGKPLIEIAHGRSGDKGDTSNVGIVARKPEYWPLLRHLLRPENVKNYLAHLVKGEVHTFELPQVQAFNLVMKEALDGGGMTSMRNDPLGKGMAQVLLNMKITE